MSESNTLYLLIATLLIPVASAGIAFIVKEKYGWLIPVVSSLLLLSAAVIILFPLLANSQQTETYATTWLSIGTTSVQVGILSSPVTRLMAAVVLFVSAMVHIFSIGYVVHEKNTDRYFGFLGVFTFAMLGLVYSSNLMVTFCFWELVGFCSYRLIAHKQYKPAASRAATKAFLITKAGDVAFLIGLLLLWIQNGTLELTTLTTGATVSTLAGICIFIGVVGKSAQFPLFNWLPDAMQGPTPVSALIHAATMVAAGIFVLVQLAPVFTPETLWLITGVGVTSALMAAVGAWLATDIKKILAYSTISQLGFMLMALGLGEISGAFVHLLHHAFFKAGLFLSAGAIIHSLHQATHHQPDFDVQDIRNLGGLRKQMPLTFAGFAVCAAALAGIPATTGYLSKEMILTAVHQQNLWWLEFAVWVILFATPLYIFRLFWFTFLRPAAHTLPIQEAPWVMRIPVLVLAAGSITFLVYKGQLQSFATQMLQLQISVPAWIMAGSVVVTTMALLVGWLRRNARIRQGEFIIQNFLDKWNAQLILLTTFVARLANVFDRKWIDGSIHALAYSKVALAHMVGWADKNIVDGTVSGITHITRGLGGVARSVVNGKIQSYLLWAIAGLLIFIIWMLY
ncbi:MAG: NADH-quinone oxidoreductase subunit L [Bacteroidetes bacterium CHB5]|nr:NADH-quinone oxidoreductase subunit L [Bacteroidetes bacterium CHB5]